MCLELAGGEEFEIPHCPKRYAGHESNIVIQLAEFARHGAMPVTGGTLDQSQQFIEAANLIWSEQERYRHARRSLPQPD